MAEAGDNYGFRKIEAGSPAKPAAKTPIETDTPGFGFRRLSSTAMEKAGAFAESLAHGATESFPEVSGGAAGAATGLALGAMTGPLAPVAMPLGFIGGGVAGTLAGRSAGREAAKGIGLRSPEAMPKEERPFGVAGEFTGASLPFIAAPMAAAEAGLAAPATRVGNFINRMIDEARRGPISYLESQLGAVLRAGTAGGAAEAISPGDRRQRTIVETAAAFINPFSLATGLFQSARAGGSRLIRLFSPAARESAAGRRLQEALALSGEDAGEVSRLLTSNVRGEPVTAAQATGSKALAKLEATLARDNEQFEGVRATRAERSLSAVNGMVIALRGTGDPAAFIEAGRLQQQRFRIDLMALADQARKKALASAGDIAAGTPNNLSQLSKAAQQAVTDAMRQARAVEAEFWGAVPKDGVISGRDIIDRGISLRATMLPEEEFPPLVKGFLKRLTNDNGTMTTGDAILFRSRMLASAREAAAQNRFNDARIFGSFAEAALDSFDGASLREVEDARNFSREFNDVFSRTFAGKALAREESGANRIPPELMMNRALAVGREAADLKFEELERATRFLVTKGLGGPDAERQLATVLDAQEQTLRIMAAQAVDPQTGLVNAARLARVARDNSSLLSRFPVVRQKIDAAIKSENVRRDVEAMVKETSRISQQRADFARVAKFENGADAVKAALAGGTKTPLAALRDLINVAKRGGRDAVEGLKASAFENAARTATKNDGTMNWSQLAKQLFGEIRPGESSLIDSLVDGGIMSASDRATLQELMLEAGRIQSTMEATAGRAVPEDAPGALLDFMLRVQGAQAGELAKRGLRPFGHLGGGPGPSLIAAQAGSKLVRQAFARLQSGKLGELMIRAMKDPEFARMLLAKPATPAEHLALAQTISVYLVSAGLAPLPGVFLTNVPTAGDDR